MLSSATEPSLEETAAAVDYPKVYQLYIYGDWEWVKDMVARVKEAGYSVFCLTVDTAHYSRRERPMVHRWTPPTRRRPPDRAYESSVTWETVDRLEEIVGMPFMIKGIATAEDAALAVAHGVDAVWVSDHGGRQLDHGLGTMDVLPEIVDAVGSKADVILDGGVQRGNDVLKAVALGAKAVLIGKLQGWGLAAAGTAGLVRVLEILEDELVSAMALLGVTSIDQVSTAHVTKGEVVTSPHEMSTWVNMTDGRML